MKRMTMKALRALAAQYDIAAYRRKGGWYIRENGTFPYPFGEIRKMNDFEIGRTP